MFGNNVEKYCMTLMIMVIFSCTKEKPDSSGRLFKKIENSGIEFTNHLPQDSRFDVFRYRNYYNGGGVAIGDINNDGLSDVYLTSNASSNRLYLNKGNFEFEDITELSATAGTKAWSTGVSMVDVNGDGWLDIYVCNSGDIKGDDKENELFINQGDMTFIESAKEYGLADEGFSTHAIFFDYDLDGDLDLYLLNNSFRPISTFGYENIRHQRDSYGGDKLYRNDDMQFIDVSEKAGIYGSVIGFGLGASVSDINRDGYMDIYVSNDFFERDYLYMNQGDGTFEEKLYDMIGHTSLFSMGADIADINNDMLPDIYVTDMLPEHDKRLKTVTSFDSYEVYYTKLQTDYYHQYSRNTLQLNNGNGSFSEIGFMTNMAKTDWSWGALIADFDNDGWKDIHVTNGIFKDVTDQDYLNYLGNDENIQDAIQGKSIDFSQYIDKMSSTKLSNYLFTRQNNLLFHNVSSEWGLDEPSFSNGAAYGDLDNDGDLDLIINNVNQPTFIYQNQTNNLRSHHYIRLHLIGKDKNKNAIGTKIFLRSDSLEIYWENMPTTGFQSSMDHIITLGLGANPLIDELRIEWPLGGHNTFFDITADTMLTLYEKNAMDDDKRLSKMSNKPLLVDITPKTGLSIYRHKENLFLDFNRERLLYQTYSNEGPAIAVGDVNNDDLDDIFIGGARKQTSMLFIQQKDGTFYPIDNSFLRSSFHYEDVDAVFFDADNDGDNDLYVVSGGTSVKHQDPILQDRLYINEGVENNIPMFKPSPYSLPPFREVGSCVRPADFDNDGDIDLFVGSRVLPGYYGFTPINHLLINNGKGHFSSQANRYAPDLSNVGMVTDAAWVDYDSDQDLDLVVVGEWMPIVLFENVNGRLQMQRNPMGLEKSNGWWYALDVVDVNKDKKPDLILGNLGYNSKFKASKTHPAIMYVDDFDDNGYIEQIYTYWQNDKLYPMALRHDLVEQLVYLKKKYVYYKDYAEQTIQDIFTTEQLNNAREYKAYTFASSIAINKGNGQFDLKPLPEQAQYSPIYAILDSKFSDNKNDDILLAGNFSTVKPEIGKYDALYGLLLRQDGENLKPISSKESGFFVRGDVRNMKVIRTLSGIPYVLVAKNNDTLQVFEINNSNR